MVRLCGRLVVWEILVIWEILIVCEILVVRVTQVVTKSFDPDNYA